MKRLALLRASRPRRPPLTTAYRSCTILAPKSSPSDTPSHSEHAALTDRLTGTSGVSSYMNRQRTGVVTDITNGIANIDGFTCAKPYSQVEFDNGVRGLVLNVNTDGCKIGIIDNGSSPSMLKNSDLIRLDKLENLEMRSPSTTVGPGLVGRIVDVFGDDFSHTLNQAYKANTHSSQTGVNEAYKEPVFKVNLFPNSKYVTEWTTYCHLRQRIHTGIKSIDAFYPLASGLRTAIIGSKAQRKSELAIDVLLSFLTRNRSTSNIQQKMFGVYVMIGKSPEEIWRLYGTLADAGALEYCTIVASRDDDLLSKQLLTPYAGAAIADFYKFHGANSFIVYDNLTVHNRVCSKLYRESKGLMTYGNWSGELLERASQLNGKYGFGSHTALCIADRPTDDDELNVESETFFNYLPHLVTHVDEHIMLSDESLDAGMVPPISLFPVPYGVPKFMKYNAREMDNMDGNDDSEEAVSMRGRHAYDYVLMRLSIEVKKLLFDLVEMESAARAQMELDLDLEPDVERIASKVFKLQVLFTQNEEISTQQLLLLMMSIHGGLIDYIHMDKVYETEKRLYEYVIDAKNELWTGVMATIVEKGREFDIDNNEAAGALLHAFLDDNSDLCKPNELSKQDLAPPSSKFY